MGHLHLHACHSFDPFDDVFTFLWLVLGTYWSTTPVHFGMVNA